MEGEAGEEAGLKVTLVTLVTLVFNSEPIRLDPDRTGAWQTVLTADGRSERLSFLLFQ